MKFQSANSNQNQKILFNNGNIGNEVNFLSKLTLPPTPILTWDIDVEIPSPNETFTIQLFGDNPNITVDWGNESIETFNSVGDKTNSYLTTGNYTIKISGNFTNNGNIRLGSNFTEKQKVKSISPLPFISGLTSFRESMYECTSLTSIPENLFFNNPNINNFFFAFYRCASLNSIPENLFIKNTGVTTFWGCFGYLESITSVPENIFSQNVANIYFVDCFINCTSLTSVPSGLFRNNINATDFRGAFWICTSLTGVPENLFANNTAITLFDNSFSLCTSLNSVPSGLFANNTAVTSFSSCFSSTNLSTESYSNLLINMASNSASRQNNVLFGGGNSKYNLSGQTARQTLESKNWVFSDGGLE